HGRNGEGMASTAPQVLRSTGGTMRLSYWVVPAFLVACSGGDDTDDTTEVDTEAVEHDSDTELDGDTDVTVPTQWSTDFETPVLAAFADAALGGDWEERSDQDGVSQAKIVRSDSNLVFGGQPEAASGDQFLALAA